MIYMRQKAFFDPADSEFQNVIFSSLYLVAYGRSEDDSVSDKNNGQFQAVH